MPVGEIFEDRTALEDRQRTAIGTMIASVRRVSSPDSVEVDANRPKSGVQVPRSPACWSISTPTAPPSRRNAVGPLKPFLRLNMSVARLRAAWT